MEIGSVSSDKNLMGMSCCDNFWQHCEVARTVDKYIKPQRTIAFISFGAS